MGLNVHERRAWDELMQFGAKLKELGGHEALDISTVRLSSAAKIGRFVRALREVDGRSGRVRFHVNRRGEPVFVVRD